MSSGSEIEEYGLVESILKARTVSIKGKLGWRYYVKWVGQSEDQSSWLNDSDFGEQTWIINQFWDNIEGGTGQEEYSEGDVVYAAKPWLEKLHRARGKKASSKPPQKPAASRSRAKSDDSEADEPFFRGKRRSAKSQRSSPPRKAKVTPLRQQKLDFSKARSTSKPVKSSPPVASSSRLTQIGDSKADQSAIIISSSSEDEPEEPPARQSRNPTRLGPTAPQRVGNDLDRSVPNGSKVSSERARRASPTFPFPSRRKIDSTNRVSRRANAKDIGAASSSPDSPRLTRSTQAAGPSRAVPDVSHKSPSPAPFPPTIATPYNANNGVPSPAGVVDLCTPSPEPLRKPPPHRPSPVRTFPPKRAPSPPALTSTNKRQNPFASFAFDPDAQTTARPAKKRRLEANDGPARPVPPERPARPVSPQSFRARADFKSSRPSSSKTATALDLAEDLVADAMDVVNLTAGNEQLPLSRGGGDSLYPRLSPSPGPTALTERRSSHATTGGDPQPPHPPASPGPSDFVPNGLLGGFSRPLNGSFSGQRRGLDASAPRTPVVSHRPLPSPPAQDQFSSPVNPWFSPGVGTLTNYTPLRPDGLLSSPSNSRARAGLALEEHLGLPSPPSGLQAAPTTTHDERTPLRPNGLLGSSSSPILEVSPIPRRASPITKGMDEPESEEDDVDAFFRGPRRKAGQSGKKKQISKSPSLSPSPERHVEHEAAGPESYRRPTRPALGSDELAMPASYRSEFSLELGPGYALPVRLRDVVAGQEIEMPRSVFLQGAQVYDARHARKLVRAPGAARVVPDPRTTSRLAASRQQCEWFLEFWRRLADGDKFLVLPKSGDAHHALVFAAADNNSLMRALGIPENLRVHRHCVVVAMVSAPDLDKLAPSDELFGFTGQ